MLVMKMIVTPTLRLGDRRRVETLSQRDDLFFGGNPCNLLPMPNEVETTFN
jgi:hypothetical protein